MDSRRARMRIPGLAALLVALPLAAPAQADSPNLSAPEVVPVVHPGVPVKLADDNAFELTGVTSPVWKWQALKKGTTVAAGCTFVADDSMFGYGIAQPTMTCPATLAGAITIRASVTGTGLSAPLVRTQDITLAAKGVLDTTLDVTVGTTKPGEGSYLACPGLAKAPLAGTVTFTDPNTTWTTSLPKARITVKPFKGTTALTPVTVTTNASGYFSGSIAVPATATKLVLVSAALGGLKATSASTLDIARPTGSQLTDGTCQAKTDGVWYQSGTLGIGYSDPAGFHGLRTGAVLGVAGSVTVNGINAVGVPVQAVMATSAGATVKVLASGTTGHDGSYRLSWNTGAAAVTGKKVLTVLGAFGRSATTTVGTLGYDVPLASAPTVAVTSGGSGAVLGRAFTIYGTVSADGIAVPGATVKAFLQKGAILTAIGSTKVDSWGSFALSAKVTSYVEGATLVLKSTAVTGVGAGVLTGSSPFAVSYQPLAGTTPGVTKGTATHGTAARITIAGSVTKETATTQVAAAGLTVAVYNAAGAKVSSGVTTATGGYAISTPIVTAGEYAVKALKGGTWNTTTLGTVTVS